MFCKTVNLENREEMIEFLTKHFRYNTMNSWNCMTSYANNVKLYKLDLPNVSKAYDFLDAECEQYAYDVDDAIIEFEVDTGYTAGFNGRSGGYIVLYDMERNKDGRRCMLLHGIDEYEDFKDWETSDIAERVKLVQRFDALCDEIRDIFIYYLENTEIKDVPVVIESSKRVAMLKSEE